MKEKKITYYVNSVKQETTNRKITPYNILTKAGYNPENNDLVRANNPQKILEKSIEENINPNEEFLVIPKRPNPVS
ncbi:hypothetical protein [Haloplasma contractile]|uniref:Uncharacterized protein n=1 Tax=Haloplasma contractile SSD-17B TaxID=1033810 RepID=F7Q1P9_9MOLU|nr:hypothetical protein [Haloplasma contractile]ERJ12288.1 hypothetical protein HLPCO_001815 [Haloplasma contractile SSD-17B]